MKRNDHLALAVYLVGLSPERLENRLLRAAYFAGSVLPDCNPATYLRGATRAPRPAGHDRQYSYPQILRLVSALRRTGVHNARQAYRLGALMHYLADAFTYPHTPHFRGDIPAHNCYERALHRVFGAALSGADRKVQAPADPFRFLCDEMAKSEREAHTPPRDAAQIIRVCTGIWWSVFQENDQKSPISNKKS